MTIPDDHLDRMIAALEHYAAYMKAARRDDRPYRETAELLRSGGERKAPGREETPAVKKKERRA